MDPTINPSRAYSPPPQCTARQILVLNDLTNRPRKKKKKKTSLFLFLLILSFTGSTTFTQGTKIVSLNGEKTANHTLPGGKVW
uniref:Uncharacterized protein n=1 Tax=Salix viminalis TaxID=40686 RepID=A0A6N2MXY8_SALVM